MRGSMKNNYYFTRLVIFFFILMTFVMAISAQETRSITSNDFVKQRPSAQAASAPNTGGNVTAIKNIGKKPKRAIHKYKLVRGYKTPQRKTKTAPPKTATKITDIGITTWKLRPPHASEKDFVPFPVRMDNGETKMWLAERVDAETIFQNSDKVRFAIESSTPGYLYVFNRETRSDGSNGDTKLIFPYSLNDDNSVRSGMLVDIPDQREQWPYFNMRSTNRAYSGELVTVIISSKPLTGFKISPNGKLENEDELANMENGSVAEIYNRDDMDDKIFSKTESDASCGVKKRELAREETPGKPCGTASRELTREEAHPQSIYRIKSDSGKPVVAFFRLTVGK